MVKEIKIRAWDGNKMYYSFPCETEMGKLEIITFPGSKNYTGIDIIMQYIELIDKNGNQYCQDDIVLYKDQNYRLIKGKYMFELFSFYDPSQDIPCDFFSEGAYKKGEIIGNIYENPELIIL